MNSVVLDGILREARKNPLTKALSYDSTPKTVVVCADKMEYEHRTYSDHKKEKGVKPDSLQMSPSHVKSGEYPVQVCRGGSCDVFKIGELWGYRPWPSDPAKEPSGGSAENPWVRVRMTRLVSIISGIDPCVLSDAESFYMQWDWLSKSGLTLSIEGEHDWRGTIEICNPQLLPEAEPARA
jgi:hypothetical protein